MMTENKKTKVCKVHGTLAEKDIKSGIYRNKKYAKCRFCENERAALYQKNLSAEKKQKKLERDNLRWKENKGEITKKRRDPLALAKRRAWYHKNIHKVREECNLKQEAYRENLDDSYVRKIIHNGDKNIPMASIPLKMIELKRAIMFLKRKFKSLKFNK